MDTHHALAVPRRNALAAKRGVLKMSISVTLGFLLCMTPYCVVSLVRIYSDYYCEWPTALAVSEMLVMAHSVINPILYTIFSRRAVLASLNALFERASTPRPSQDACG